MSPFIPQSLPIREIAWESLIPLMSRSNRSLAQYDGILYGVPNPEVLLAPLTTQEAVLSSKIEGTQATLGEVLKFDAGEKPESESKHQDILEIINYRRALHTAEDQLRDRPFNLNLLLHLHEILLDSVRGENKARGRFRVTQNWIGSPGSAIDQALFVPPEPALVPGALDNLEKYYHSDEPDALVQLALIHAQFGIILPFLDGNGRLGRIVVPLFLYEKKILSRPMFYLSSWLEKHRDEYVRRLRALGREENAWNAWVAFFLTGLDEQAQANAAKARAIMDLYQELKARIITLTRSQYAIPLLDSLFERPVFQASHIGLKGCDPSRQAVNTLIRKLREAGIIKVIRSGSGQRGQVLAFADLVNLCEDKPVI